METVYRSDVFEGQIVRLRYSHMTIEPHTQFIVSDWSYPDNLDDETFDEDLDFELLLDPHPDADGQGSFWIDAQDTYTLGETEFDPISTTEKENDYKKWSEV